jgi:hypothetical protein
MKSKKVLLGLFAGLLTLTGGVARAQFYEIGPANIGGMVSSLLVDNQDETHSTVYAGTYSGGLYVRTSNDEVLQNLYDNMGQELRGSETSRHEIWHLVRYYDADNNEIVLPVSAMAQDENGFIYIGTGDLKYQIGSTYQRMSSKGRGIYRYNPEDGSFALLPYTDQASGDNFAAVNKMAVIDYEGKTYLYVATWKGLFRWSVDGNVVTWANATPAVVATGNVSDIVLLENFRTGYYTIGNQVYKIGDITASHLHTVNISPSNQAFGLDNLNVKLAVSPSDNNYLYAMVIGADGLMENVYLTTNGQSWHPITTSTITPFTSNSGTRCGALIVDPANPKRLVVGGSTLWVGQNYVENSYYQWSKSSYSERELNRGDYMSSVFNSVIFVHSGINDIVQTNVEVDGETVSAYYIATDGGVYMTTDEFTTYENINLGMNNLQMNGVAVAPDGSLITGAMDNSSPFIESRMTHNGGVTEPSWFQDGSIANLNHNANILWNGNGGLTAASAFQQLKPQSRRTIFVSSEWYTQVGQSGYYYNILGRAYDDYLDFTNTQTWTSGQAFATDVIKGGPSIGQMYLWETDHDTYFRDSITVALDTLGYYFRANGDTAWIQSGNERINAGSKAVFLNKGTADYPIEYTFTRAQYAKDSIRIKNPIQSHMVTVGKASDVTWSVFYSWMPSDFSKVFDEVEYTAAIRNEAPREVLYKQFYWAPVLTIHRTALLGTQNLYPRCAVISRDGRTIYAAAYDTEARRSMLFRIKGIDQANYCDNPFNVRNTIDGSSLSYIVVDTMKVDGSVWIERAISSIAVDPREGQDRLIITFEDYSDSYANVAVVNNAGSANWSMTQNIITGHKNLPAFCAMVEKTTGDIYVGTATGVWVCNYSTNAWSEYEYLRGMPVTSMCQQTWNLPVRHALTHTGITANNYVFAKTKWPNAMYFATYGRGVFMDMRYVTDTTNEVCDSADYNPVSIPTVNGSRMQSVSIYPNPVSGEANIVLNSGVAGNAQLRVYDLNGRLVMDRRLGMASEGEQVYTVDAQGLARGMYLVNIIVGGHTAATKMIVR